MIRPTIAQIAALDNRIEDVLRTHGPMKLGEIAKSPRIAEMAAYHQVVTALRRLHASKRITTSGLPPSTMYSLAPGAERMTPVASEPKLGDRVWGLDGSTILRGEFVGRTETRSGWTYMIEVDGMQTVVHRVTLDGCRLVREIEQEESK